MSWTHRVPGPRRATATAALAVLLLVGACAQGGDGTRACTLIGGVDGVSVDIPMALFVAAGSVVIEVCDTEACASARQRLRPVPGGRPVGRGTGASFDDLGRTFSPGQVTVTVRLSNAADELVATASDDVELRRDYPNGQACDEGFVSGSLTMTASDRV